MALINFILNLIALVFWFGWISVRMEQGVKISAVSLLGTLKKAERSNPRRWRYLLALILILGIRAMVFTSLTNAAQKIDLGIITLSFRGGMGMHYLGQMLLFSVLDFFITLAAFYNCLLLLSVVNAKIPDGDSSQKLVRGCLRWVETWPRAFKVFLPFLLGMLFWLAFQPLLARLSIIPHAGSFKQLGEQSALIGAAVYLPWKNLIVAVLLLHIINSYVYLGTHSIWNYVNHTARNLLWPISWLPVRVGKVDFLPVIGIALVFALTEAFSHLTLMHPRWLPF